MNQADRRWINRCDLEEVPHGEVPFSVAVLPVRHLLPPPGPGEAGSCEEITLPRRVVPCENRESLDK